MVFFMPTGCFCFNIGIWEVMYLKQASKPVQLVENKVHNSKQIK